MNKTKSRQRVLSLLLLVYGCVFIVVTSREGLSANNADTAELNSVKTALSLEIVADKKVCLFGESLAICAKFRNTSEATIAVDLSKIRFIHPNSKQLLFMSPNLGSTPSRNEISLGTSFLIPANSEVSIVVPDIIFPAGIASAYLKYEYLPTNAPSRRFNAIVCQGEALSNIITVEVKENADLSEKNKKKIEEQISKLIEAMPSVYVKGPQYWSAYHFLIDMVPYSVPVLFDKLEHPDPEKRIAALDVLRAIANERMRPEKRTCTFWKELISAYHRESNVAVKKAYLTTLGRCWDLPLEQRVVISRFIREEMKQGQDEDFRLAAALGYLYLDAVDALDSIIGDGLLDDGTFGEKSIPFLLKFIRIHAGASAMWLNSAAELKDWWKEEENKAELEAKRKERDEMRRYDQNQ